MKSWIYFLLIFFTFYGFSQNEEINLEEFAERLFQVQDENISYEDLYESLLLYYTDKLNLNEITYEELSSLYILNPKQLKYFFQYREKIKVFYAVNELQTIPTFDLNTVRLLMPFVTTNEEYQNNNSFLGQIFDDNNNYFLLRYSSRLEQQLGYTDALPVTLNYIKDDESNIVDTVESYPARYLGDNNKIYGRFRSSKRKDFSLGFTFEKDNGEMFTFNSKQTGFDFYSYHLLLEEKLGVDKLMLGDFQLQAGQGLLYGAGFNVGKGSETIFSTKRNTIGIRPYTSVLEDGFFRGIGITKSLGNIKLTSFYSNIKKDGNILSDTISASFNEYVSSIQATGFHRTETEIENKDNIKEKSLGALLQYKPNRKILLGISGLNSKYSVPLVKTPNNYNQFEFRGNHNYIYSIFAQYIWENIFFFGEGAQSKSGGIGAVAGFMGSLSKTVDFSFLIRNFDKNFHSFYGNAFSENSRNINEKGIYWGLSISPKLGHKVNLYYDLFAFPSLKYGVEAPSSGKEWLIRYTYNPNKLINLNVQIRQQTRQVSVANENLNVLTNQIRYNYLLNVDYKLESNLSLKTKIQSSHQSEAGTLSKGFVILQDLIFDFWKLKFNTRLALFETDNFDNAQYVYENDVLYSFSIPPYNGKGIRNYVMVRFDPNKKTSLWIRYGRYSFKDRESIGSSLDTSFGRISSEIKIMVRFKL